MPDEPSGQEELAVDLSVLLWLLPAIEGDLLGYVLAIEPEALTEIIVGQAALDSYQAGVVIALNQLRAALPQEFDEATSTNAVRACLTQLGSEGVSVARGLHKHIRNDETVPETDDAVEASLVILALDSYAAYQLSPDRFFPMWERPAIEVTRLLFKHPQNIIFMAEAEKDPRLKKLFPREYERGGGSYGMIFRNTGSGNSVQLLMLAQTLLTTGWHHLDKKTASPSTFATQALRELQFIRDVISGEPRTITARVGLMGVLLPTADSRLALPNGIVRPMTAEDRRYAPESLKGELSTTDSSGVTTVINYDGDLVLEIQQPFKLRIVDKPMGDTPIEFPRDLMQSSSPAEETLLRLRFSLMLAVERESRAQIVPTWRAFDDPFNAIGHAWSWSDPRQGAAIMPIQLTEDEVAKWSQWYSRLITTNISRIELALSRILKALAERREPSDVLVDSVIAWENLFGTDQGELNFRISMSLAVLLEDSFEARKALRKQISDIYALRSKVVHGSRNLKLDEYPKCQEALDIAIRAIRALTTTRTDVLALSDGAARSAALLLGSGSPSADD